MTADDQRTLLTVALYVGGVLLVRTVAKRKGYNPSPWVLGALVFWPGALLLILLKQRDPRQFRRCPDCGSTDIPYDAPVCRHCGRDERTQQKAAPPSEEDGAAIRGGS